MEKIKCYHISKITNRNSILEKGLIPFAKKGEAITYKPRIFFSTDKNNLGFDYVDYFDVDVWEFELPKNKVFKDEFCSSDCFCYSNVKVKEVILFASL